MLKKINIIKDDPSLKDKKRGRSCSKTTLKSLFELIDKRFNEITEKMDKMNESIQTNNDKIEYLSLKLESMKGLMKFKDNDDYRKDVKEIKFIIGEDFPKDKVLQNLSLRSVTGDINLINYYYLVKGKESIELVNQRRFEYWNDGRWHIDLDGHKIASVITKNLQRLYAGINSIKTIESYSFLQNQVHINRLQSDKYKKQLIKQLKVDIQK